MSSVLITNRDSSTFETENERILRSGTEDVSKTSVEGKVDYGDDGKQCDTFVSNTLSEQDT